MSKVPHSTGQHSPQVPCIQVRWRLKAWLQAVCAHQGYAVHDDVWQLAGVGLALGGEA